MFRVYGCPITKLFYLNKTIQTLPAVYVGNTYLNGFVKDSNQLVIKTNDNYIIKSDPNLMKRLEINYKNVEENCLYEPLAEPDLKKLTIFYRISQNLWNKQK